MRVRNVHVRVCSGMYMCVQVCACACVFRYGAETTSGVLLYHFPPIPLRQDLSLNLRLLLFLL